MQRGKRGCGGQLLVSLCVTVTLQSIDGKLRMQVLVGCNTATVTTSVSNLDQALVRCNRKRCSAMVFLRQPLESQGAGCRVCFKGEISEVRSQLRLTRTGFTNRIIGGSAGFARGCVSWAIKNYSIKNTKENRRRDTTGSAECSHTPEVALIAERNKTQFVSADCACFGLTNSHETLLRSTCCVQYTGIL